MTVRSKERNEFLTDVLTTAIENYGYGWFAVLEYDPDAGTARIEEEDDDRKTFEVNLDTIARGIGVINDAVLKSVSDSVGEPYEVPHNARTDERLYLSEKNRLRILKASRENEAGDLDVIDALAILECALFGRVVYA